MFKILGILAAGAICGLLTLWICGRRQPPSAERVLSPLVWLMLFAFGAGIGRNPDIISNLPTLGATAAMLGIMALAGSVLACALLQLLAKVKDAPPRTEMRGMKGQLTAMRGSLITVGLFVAGMGVGRADFLPAWIDAEEWSEYFLYLLIGFVGYDLGAHPRRELLHASAAVLLVAPVSVAGTAVAGIAAGLLPAGLGIAESIAGVSGMGYYSLSSLLISQLKIGALGAEGALQLGAIALMSNIVRELTTLLLAPVISRRLGSYALVGAAGVTSLDVTLPAIRTNGGDSAVATALINGIMLEVATPLLVTAACAL